MGRRSVCSLTSNRQELFGYHPLLHYRLELIVNNESLIDLFIVGKSFNNIARNLKRLRKIHPPFAGNTDVFAGETGVSPAKEIPSLASDRKYLNLLVGVITKKSLAGLDQICVESPTETLIGGDEDEKITFVAAGIE